MIQEALLNLEKLCALQEKLDRRIIEEKQVVISPKQKKIALFVEFAETLNEWKGFKVWSTKPQDREKLLFEYVDGLHFMLSFANDYDVPYEHDLVLEDETIEEQIITFISLLTRMNGAMDWWLLFAYYRGLGVMLGLDWEEVEKGYYEKNKINHERQDNGY